MRKAYVLLYSDSVGTRDQIKAWADSEPKVITWRYDLPHCFYIISEHTAEELAQALQSYIKRRGRFLIMETSENRQGWLPPETWYLLRQKKHKPSES